MPGFVLQVYPAVLQQEFPLSIQYGGMTSQGFRLRMRIHRIRLPGAPGLLRHDRYRPPRPYHIFYKKRRFAHHRPPSSLVPSDRPVFKPDLQLSVIVITGRDIFGEPGADGADLYRPGSRHLAHYIDIMHAAIHYRAETFHEIAMHRPHPAMALLVQVHAHHQRLAQSPRQVHKTLP